MHREESRLALVADSVTLDGAVSKLFLTRNAGIARFTGASYEAPRGPLVARAGCASGVTGAIAGVHLPEAWITRRARQTNHPVRRVLPRIARRAHRVRPWITLHSSLLTGVTDGARAAYTSIPARAMPDARHALFAHSIGPSDKCRAHYTIHGLPEAAGAWARAVVNLGADVSEARILYELTG